KLIAPWWHTLSVLAIFAFFAWRGARQAAENPNPLGTSSGSGGSLAIQYLILIGSEVLIAYWVWVGVHWRGGTLWDLVRGRWSNWRDVARDFAIAIPFWVIWELTAKLCARILYSASSPAEPYHVPAGAAEVCGWLGLCLAAGFCEELVFRG